MSSPNFSEVIREKRQRMRLTQEDFAKLLDVTSTTIYNWEKGNTKPHSRDWDKLCKLLSIEDASIFYKMIIESSAKEENIKTDIMGTFIDNFKLDLPLIRCFELLCIYGNNIENFPYLYIWENGPSKVYAMIKNIDNLLGPLSPSIKILESIPEAYFKQSVLFDYLQRKWDNKSVISNNIFSEIENVLFWTSGKNLFEAWNGLFPFLTSIIQNNCEICANSNIIQNFYKTYFNKKYFFY